MPFSDWLRYQFTIGGGGGGQGWRSGESARLPLMCLGFDSRTRRHMWVEFVVGSLPCSERFFPSPQKPTFPNSNSIWNCQALYHEPLARVIAQALPLFDIKFAFLNFFTINKSFPIIPYYLLMSEWGLTSCRIFSHLSLSWYVSLK